MRVLVISDIHANWAALSAIKEPHDLCVCLGDLVDYGPQPIECIDWIRENAHCVVRGNHDHGVAQRIVASGSSGFKQLASVTRRIMWQLLDEERVRFLGQLPISKYVRVGEKVLFLVHATPRDPLDEYLFADPDAWALRVERVEADIICVGHTHHQFAVRVGDKIVLNPGSVGQPRDNDPRACYAVIDEGKIEIKRVAYNIEDTISRLENLDIPPEAKRFAAQVLRTGNRPAPVT